MTADFIELAAKKIPNTLAALLAPHKIALLALENESAKLMKEKVSAAPTKQRKLQTAKVILKAAQGTSAKLAYQHGLKEFKLLGISPPDQMPVLDQDYNAKLLDTLKQNSFSDDSLSDEQKAYRASLAASSSANHAYTDMQLAMYSHAAQNNSVQKVWVANFTTGSPPCKYCSVLHNTSVPLDKPFPTPHGLDLFDGLNGPPAHIHCKCRLGIRVLNIGTIT